MVFIVPLQEVIDSGKTNLHFVRVHAPWMVLCKYAEELNLRAPIQVRKQRWRIKLENTYSVNVENMTATPL